MTPLNLLAHNNVTLTDLTFSVMDYTAQDVFKNPLVYFQAILKSMATKL